MDICRTNIPLSYWFQQDTFEVDIQNIGFIAGIPNFCGIIGLAGGAVLADYLRNQKILQITNVSGIIVSKMTF